MNESIYAKRWFSHDAAHMLFGDITLTRQCNALHFYGYKYCQFSDEKRLLFSLIFLFKYNLGTRTL